MIIERARYDVADELYRACQQTKPGAGAALCSKNATWFACLREAVRHTRESDMPARDWINGLHTAMAAAGIDWAPGRHRGRLSSRHIVRLVGQRSEVTGKAIKARPGSLKRAAIEASELMAQEEQSPKRPRRRTVTFGEDIPFARLPRLLQEAFEKVDKLFEKGHQGVRAHYQIARHCLLRQLETPACNLLLLLVLTVASSTVTPQVALGEDSFSAAPKRKDPLVLAATMVTRMLWFLHPSAFPWDKDDRGVLRVAEMTKKIGMYFMLPRLPSPSLATPPPTPLWHRSRVC